MELTVHNISNDKTIGSNTVQGLKDFNSQYLATQAKTESFYDACYL